MPSLRDDRGTALRRSLIGLQRDEIAKFNEAFSKVMQSRRGRLAVYLMLSFVLVLIGGPFLVMGVIGEFNVPWLIALVVALLMFGAFASHFHTGAKVDATLEVRRQRRCCGACLYDLRGSPVDADGLTICPECGAAWRLRPPNAPDQVEAEQ